MNFYIKDIRISKRSHAYELLSSGKPEDRKKQGTILKS